MSKGLRITSNLTVIGLAISTLVLALTGGGSVTDALKCYNCILVRGVGLAVSEHCC